jgi:hypothetical protein
MSALPERTADLNVAVLLAELPRAARSNRRGTQSCWQRPSRDADAVVAEKCSMPLRALTKDFDIAVPRRIEVGLSDVLRAVSQRPARG